MIRRSTLFACGIILLCPTITFAQTWTGTAGDGLWETAANWDSDPALPSGNTNLGGGATVGLSTSQTIGEIDIVGDQSAGTAVLNQTAGALSGGGWAKVGVDGGNDGTLSLSNAASFSGFTQLHAGTGGGTGTINVTDNSVINHSSNLVLAEDNPGGVGTLNVSGNGAVNTGDRWNIGIQGTGTVNISDSATVSLQTFNSAGGGGTAVVNQTGGTVTSNSWFALGQGNTTQPNGGGSATYNHSGGTLDVSVADTEFLTIGENGSGTYNASGTADINSVGGFLVGRNGNGDNLGDGLFEITGSTVTIDGGDLRVGLTSTSADQGAMGELSWIADAGGISTIVSADNTEFGQFADLTVDLTADSAFSTWTTTPTGALMDIAVLVDNSASVAGTFTGLAEGASVSIGGGQTAFITYVGGDGNDIILQTYVDVVPEPGSAAILALAGMGLMFRRRRN